MSNLLKVVSLLSVLLICTVYVHAQPPSPGGEVNAPVDGGLSLLIAGGIGYGMKRLKEKRSSNCNKKTSRSNES